MCGYHTFISYNDYVSIFDIKHNTAPTNNIMIIYNFYLELFYKLQPLSIPEYISNRQFIKLLSTLSYLFTVPDS